MIQSRRRHAEAGRAGGVDVLRPLRARSRRGIERCRPREDRCGAGAPRRDFAAGDGARWRRRCAACCRTRRRSSPDPLDAGRDRGALSGAHARGARDGRLAVVLHARRRAQPPRRAARQGADGGAPPRHDAAHRPGHAARRDDAVRDLLDARRLRRAAHDRQHVLPQALLGRRAIPTTSPARAGCASWSTRATAGGCSRCRPPSRSASATAAGSTASTSRTVTVRALASGDDPAMQWRIAVEGEPCRFLVFGHLVLGERELDHAGRIEIDAGASAFAFRPDPTSLWGQRYPDAVYHLVTSTPGRDRGDRRRRAAVRRRPGRAAAPTWRCGRGATNELCFAVVGSMTDPEAAERLAAKYERGVDDAAMLAPAARVLGAGHPRPAHHRRQPRGRGARYHLPVACAQRDGAPHRAARPGAVYRRRVGHARRLPGPGRVPAGARARRAGQGDPADRLRAAVRGARRLAAVVHARALRRDPRPAQPWRRDRLAAEGAVRLRRGDRTISRSSTSRSRGGGRTASSRRRARTRSRRMSTSCSPPCASGSSPARI